MTGAIAASMFDVILIVIEASMGSAFCRRCGKPLPKE